MARDQGTPVESLRGSAWRALRPVTRKVKSLLRWVHWMVRGGRSQREMWETWGRTYILEPGRQLPGPEHDWLIRSIRARAPRRVLEIGCGFGRNLAMLTSTPPSELLAGCDMSSTMLGWTPGYTERQGALVQAQLPSLPFRDRSFDVVFTHGVLMHVPPDLIRPAFAEMRRVCGAASFHVEETTPGQPIPPSSRAVNAYTYVHDYAGLGSEAGLILRHSEVQDELALLEFEHPAAGRSP